MTCSYYAALYRRCIWLSSLYGICKAVDGGGPIGPKQKLSCNYVAFQLSALELTLLTTMMIMMKMLNQILAAMNMVIQQDRG